MGNTIQKPIQKAALDSTFDCQICLEPIISNKKFYNKETCFHIFCVDCVSKYIGAKLEDSVANVRCPGMNCGKLLDPFSCQPIIPKRLFDRWMNLLCISKILGFQKCYCPNRSCSVLIINEGRRKDKGSKCPKCKQPFCFNCKIQWKSGHLCSQKEDDIDMNDILFVETAQEKGWVRCPECNFWIERGYGLPIITCRCQTKFCYHCGRRCSQHTCSCNEYVRELNRVVSAEMNMARTDKVIFACVVLFIIAVLIFFVQHYILR